jgi:hypothetical protein
MLERHSYTGETVRLERYWRDSDAGYILMLET